MIVLLVLLLLVPIATRYWSKRRMPASSWGFAGAAFGLIASPFSLGLYGTYFIGPVLGPVLLITGLFGLLLTLFHGPPGYYLAIWLGLIQKGTIVQGASAITVEVMNGLVWGIVYGTLGVLVDIALSHGLRSNKRWSGRDG